MFIGIQYGKVKFYLDSLPTNMEFYYMVEWKETNDTYILIGDEYVLDNEDSAKKKRIKELEDRILEIKEELKELDSATIRPLRAGEAEILKNIEEHAEALREEMHNYEDEIESLQ